LGLTEHGVRAVLDVVLIREEDVVSYWNLLVRLWRRYNLTLVVADGVKALDTAISSPDLGREADLPGSPQTEGGQEDEGLAGPPPLPRRVRPHLWLPPSSYLLAPREASSSGRTTRPVLQLPPGEFGKRHSPWRIARAMALNYNLSTCYLALVIILQDPLFLREMIKYIQ